MAGRVSRKGECRRELSVVSCRSEVRKQKTATSYQDSSLTSVFCLLTSDLCLLFTNLVIHQQGESICRCNSRNCSVRPPKESDIPAIVDLLNASSLEIAGTLEASIEDYTNTWHSPGYDAAQRYPNCHHGRGSDRGGCSCVCAATLCHQLSLDRRPSSLPGTRLRDAPN